MPNKTIYVSDDDLPLFERAQELDGESLSSAIARAVRRFVEVEQALAKGFEEVTVAVGKAASRKKKRFLGVRLATWRLRSKTQKREDILDVYQTAKGQFAVHLHTVPSWSFWSDPGTWKDPANWDPESDWEQRGEYTLEVFASLDQLKEHIPDDLYQVVVEAAAGSPLEDLDI